MKKWPRECQYLRLLPGATYFVVFAQSPASTTPPIEISSSRLTKLTRRTTDRKSEFLKTLKDDRNGDFSESRECEKLEDVRLWVLLGQHKCFSALYMYFLFLREKDTVHFFKKNVQRFVYGVTACNKSELSSLFSIFQIRVHFKDTGLGTWCS